MKRLARGVIDPAGLGDLFALDHIGGIGQFDPDEQPALGSAKPLKRIGKLPEHLKHRIALLLHYRIDAIDVRPQVLAEILVHDRRGQRTRSPVPANLQNFAQQGLLGKKAPQAHARPQNFGQRFDMHHRHLRRQGIERGHVIIVFVHRIGITVIFHDRERVLRGDLQQFLAPLEGHNRACGILKRRQHVNELGQLALRGPFFEFIGQRVHPHAVFIHRNAHQFRALFLIRANRTRITKFLHHHPVAGLIDKHLRHQGHGLHRAISQCELVHRGGDALAM